MKNFITCILLFFTFQSFCEVKKDSIKTKSPIKVSGNIQLTNNGISPVPAFSLGKPAIMTSFVIKKDNISFNPEFNYGIDGKPWSSNNWLRIQFPKNKITFRTGINWSLFFKRETVTENNRTFEVQRVNKYLETEIAVFYQISKRTSLNLIWWHDNGIDLDAIRYGNFYSFSATISKVPLSNDIFITLRPNLFYLQNDIPFEGLFCSGIGIFSYKNCPFTLSIQGVQPITTNPSTVNNWNLGLNFSF